MPRAARKILIQEMPDGKFALTPIIQSTPRRTHEFDSHEAALEYLWQLLVLTEETYMVEYAPIGSPNWIQP